MKIKIYEKDWTPLTTLLSVGESDFNNLSYRSVMMETGSASFVMRLDSAKCTPTNLAHYNKVEITDDDDTVRWCGVIVQKEIRFNIVTVKCFSLIHLLNRRLTASSTVYNGDADDVVADLLADTNGASATGITLGSNTVTTNVQLTFERASVLSALKRVAEATGGQFEVNTARELVFGATIGTDLSATVTFKYDLSLIETANLINFSVNDDGNNIVSKTYGKSDALSSTQTDSALVTSFGLLEDFQNFREITNQTTLDNATSNNNNGAEYSPSITLLPSVDDNFEVGDIVEVVLKNRLVDIDDVYQILEKSVSFIGGQKQISVKIISNVTDFFKKINLLNESVKLLSREL